MKKILLDENIPYPLVKYFSKLFEVASVHDLGWAEKKNGDLIKSLLTEGFEYLLTADKNLRNQQNLDKYPVKLIIIRTFDNRLKTRVKFVEFIEQAILNAAEDEKIILIDVRNINPVS